MSQQRNENVVSIAKARTKRTSRLAEEVFSGFVNSRKVRVTVLGGDLVLIITGRGLTNLHAAAAEKLAFALDVADQLIPLTVRGASRTLSELHLHCAVPAGFDRWSGITMLAVTYLERTRRFATVPR